MQLNEPPFGPVAWYLIQSAPGKELQAVHLARVYNFAEAAAEADCDSSCGVSVSCVADAEVAGALVTFGSN